MDQTQLYREIRTLFEQLTIKLDNLITELRNQRILGAQHEEDILLDYQDVCQLMHISLRHLRRLNRGKDLVGFKIGRRRFYRNSEVQAYILKMEGNGTKK